MSSEVLRFQMLSKNVLSPEEAELYEMAQLAGVVMDPNVFKIIMDLLKMNVAPNAVLQIIKSMSGQRRKKIPSGDGVSGDGLDGSMQPPRAKPSNKGRQPSGGSRRPDHRR